MGLIKVQCALYFSDGGLSDSVLMVQGARANTQLKQNNNTSFCKSTRAYIYTEVDRESPFTSKSTHKAPTTQRAASIPNKPGPAGQGGLGRGVKKRKPGAIAASTGCFAHRGPAAVFFLYVLV